MQAIGRQPQLASDGAPVHYERHRPEQTTLYRLVQQHAATFFEQAEAAVGADLPQFVRDEFDAFLECGILAHGFLRLRCGGCGHDKLVAFSCKRRGFCPSCGAQRIAQTAAQLVRLAGSAANLNIHRHCLVLDGAAATSRALRWPTSACKPTPPGMWCSS